MDKFQEKYMESCFKSLCENKFPKLNEMELLEEFKILFDDEQIAKDQVVFFHANELLDHPGDSSISEEKIRSLGKNLFKIRNREEISSNRKLLAEALIEQIMKKYIHIFLKGVIPNRL